MMIHPLFDNCEARLGCVFPEFEKSWPHCRGIEISVAHLTHLTALFRLTVIAFGAPNP